MQDENQDENIEQETSPVQDEVSESSPEESQDSEATEEKATENVPFNEHPRWKEVMEERNAYRQQAQALQDKLVGLTERLTTPKDPEADPYQGMSQEEKTFYQNLDARYKSEIEKEVTKARKEAQESFSSELKSMQSLVGNLLAKDFLKSHPDVKKGSQEMGQITEKARSFMQVPGYSHEQALEDAYGLVMGPIQARQAQDKVKAKQKEKTKQKAEANLETQSVPKNSGIPEGKPQTFDEAFSAAEKELGIGY